MRQIVIIGGGAAGMMAAITARRAGAHVVILEQKDRVGKKILSTGNGRCNFTNTYQMPDCYRSQNESFPWKVVEAFPAEKTVAFFDELGIYAKDRNGYLYPNSDQAASVLDVLRMELARLQVEVHTEERVRKITPDGKKHFQICTETGVWQADAVIVTAGSKAAPNTGSDGSGYELARQLGHKIIPVVPALVQLQCKEKFYKTLSGVRVQGKVSVVSGNDRTLNGKQGDGRNGGKLLAEDTGELQLTGYGISGIPVFQVSRYAAYALQEKRSVTAVLDFLPELSEKEVYELFQKRIRNHPERTPEELFTGLFPKKLSQVIIQEAGLIRQKACGTFQKKEISRLVSLVKAFRTEVTKTNSFEQAQICAGGVDTCELNSSTMESKKVPGLYFAGEIVDVDGICGGYNLQWAWSSGYVAGRSAASGNGSGQKAGRKTEIHAKQIAAERKHI